MIDRITSRSPFFNEDVVTVEDGAVVVDRELARQITMESRRAAGETPNFGGIETALSGGDGTVDESYIRDAIASFGASTDAPIRVENDAVPFDPSTIEGADTGALDFDTIEASFEGDVDAFTSAPAEAFTDDRLFISTGGVGGTSVSLYETEARENIAGTATLRDDDAFDEFVDRFRTTTTDDLDALGIEPVGPSQDTQESRQRRETREAARDAAEAAGVDLDEFGIGATAEGDVIVQDRDTGRTRNVDADAPGGVGSAIDAATGNGQFVADDADPAASGSGSGDGLGVRAAGAVVLLFAAIAAALGWLS